MFKYILFDFDGTVFDTVEGITKSVRYAINLRGMDAELESLRCFAGPPLVDMFMEHFGFTRRRRSRLPRISASAMSRPDCTNAAFFQVSRSC